MMNPDHKRNALRFLIGPAVIVAVFFFMEESRAFSEVWKPLLLYYAMAIPGFFLVDKVRTRAANNQGTSS